MSATTSREPSVTASDDDSEPGVAPEDIYPDLLKTNHICSWCFRWRLPRWRVAAGEVEIGGITPDIDPKNVAEVERVYPPRVLRPSARLPPTGCLGENRLIDEPCYLITRRLRTETKYAIDGAPMNDSTVASPRAHPVGNTSVRRTTTPIPTESMNSRRGSTPGRSAPIACRRSKYATAHSGTMSRQEQAVDESFAERVDRIIDRERTVLDRLAD